MNKIKKVLVSYGVFLTSLVSKVFAIDQRMIEIKYGVIDPPEPTIWEKMIGVGKITLPIILFIIGLFVVLNKKITKKVKMIVAAILIALAIAGYILVKYFCK